MALCIGVRVYVQKKGNHKLNRTITTPLYLWSIVVLCDTQLLHV